MSTENKQDTITVDLPIEAVGDALVRVGGHVELTRSHWRDAIDNPGEWGRVTGALAPAVVAWIERDEWEPLDVPEAGRTIKATLRDGRVETFEVGEIDVAYAWAYVCKADPRGEIRHIQRVRDVYNPGPYDITAWEYVDEAPALSLAEIADELQAAVDQIREALK